MPTIENINTVEDLAERGDAQAQYQMGTILQAEKKFLEAIISYQSAAAQNHPKAQFALGRLFHEGTIVKLNTLHVHTNTNVNSPTRSFTHTYIMKDVKGYHRAMKKL
jgi:TPR repeat protein